ncbi:hypothetical protein BU054_06795 [Staphylococcus simulans]|uniref:hypothetical protein n=1 Tax=Staphylococcus simulans TaxID=1286 RepID=UPI000D1D8868|nr:hypothetical protein [Staphylococcus simulans]PTI97348.1 hypothetical protein BU054_06795 [Staphylococcus simulans]
MAELNYEDVTRIQSIILSSDYPDDLVERYVDGIESVYKKARAWDNYCKSVEKDLRNEFGNDDKRIQVGMQLNNNIFMEGEA